MSLYPSRNILCIDLKSFFAACECTERGLDLFTTPLVVADPNRGNGAITLAVTPFLRKKGVKSRGRIFEIPKNIKYIIAKPKMSLYIKKSKEVINVYLDFIASDDMHIYSIDEVFLDVTGYLKLYKKTDYELAKDIINTVYKKTGLVANAGIGPNLLLAKVAMDIDAKNNIDGIAKWDYSSIQSKLWMITPLSKMWGIGRRMEVRLNNLGIYSIGDLANYDKNKLIKQFGILGEEIWNHANGIDLSVISDLKEPPKEKSICHSQILFKDYNSENIRIIIKEMVETLMTRLRKENKKTGLLGFGIGYSKNIGGGFYHSMKLKYSTNSEKEIINLCNFIFDKYYDYNSLIRKVYLSFSRLTDTAYEQLNLFEDVNENKKELHICNTIDEINNKYGKNSLNKASSLLNDSTIIERNKKIGGHSS